MWKKSYSMVTDKVTAEQMWALFSDVNNWHTWDQGIEYARLEGEFEKGSSFLLRPKGGPEVTVKLVVTEKNSRFVDVTAFPLAKMYFEHVFEPTGQKLRITNTLSMTGLLGFLWVKLVAGKIAESMPEEMMHEIEAARKL